MGRFSKRVILLLLLSLVLLSVAIRYPLVEHERYQSDSYSIHLLAQAISDGGQAKWIFSPLSYFGLYPVSYPSGAPFLLSELSILADISMDMCILLAGIMFGIAFSLGVFCLSKEFFSRVEFAILAAFFASMAPRLVDTTYWVGSARGLVVLLILFSLVAVMRMTRTSQPRCAFMAAILVFGAFTAHHMAVVLVLFAIAYLFSFGGYSLTSGLLGRRHSRVIVPIFVLFGFAVVAIMAVVFDYFLESVERTFTGTYLFDFQPVLASTILNIAASYTHQIGFILILGIPGVVLLMRKNLAVPAELYLISVFIAFVPLLANALYISMILTPFAAIAGVMFLRTIRFRQPHFRMKAGTFGILIAVSIILPIWSISTWNSNEYTSGDTVEVGPTVFNDGLYLSVNCGDSYSISNSEVLSLQLAAISGTDFMRSGVPMAINGDLSADDVRNDIDWRGADFPINLYLWFEYEKENYPYFVLAGLMGHGLSYLNEVGLIGDFARDLMTMHKNVLVVVDNRWSDSYAGRWSVTSSEFMIEVSFAQIVIDGIDGNSVEPIQSYLIYSSERSSIYAFSFTGFI